jgi:hypothetical protein
MDPRENHKLDDRFTEAWRRWVNRTPRLSPAEAAARVGARIAAQGPSQRPRWFLAAAAAVLLVVTGVTVLWRHGRLVEPPTQTAVDQARPLGKGEVLIWLDEQTPLYMTFQEPESGTGKGDKQ